MKPQTDLPLTEQRNPVSAEIDQLSTLELCRLINRQDAQISSAVAEALPQIAQAVDIISRAIGCGYRLFYLGAGTSGRLGVLDASELQPTFSFERDRVVALIAGGHRALTESVEAAEDSLEAGKSDLRSHRFDPGDVLVGLAASGHTAYVIGGLRYAKHINAKSIVVVCNPNTPMADLATVPIEVVTGPEIITGSTRMKAGSAQKMVLNMLSTGAMIKLGKVYSNLMVDVRPTDRKLRQRAIRIVEEAAEIQPDRAQNLLELAEWDVKVAVAMALTNSTAEHTRQILKANQGRIRSASSPIGSTTS